MNLGGRLFVCFTLALPLAGCGEDSTDDGAAKLKVVEGTATSADGVEIWYRSVGGKRADSKTLLLAHGGPGLGSTYLSGFEQLASPSQRVVRYDQRGLGGSSKPSNLDYRLDRQLEDIDAVLSDLGVEHFTFLGHSWGGFIAMNYAVRSADRLDALILADSMPPTAADLKIGNATRLERIKQLQAEGLIPDPLPTEFCAWVAAILPVYFHDPRFTPPPEITTNPCNAGVASATESQSIAAGYDFTAGLATLSLPVLVVGGESDFFAALANPTAGAFEPDASVKMIPAAGHFPWIEAPDPTLAALRDFVGSH